MGRKRKYPLEVIDVLTYLFYKDHLNYLMGLTYQDEEVRQFKLSGVDMAKIAGAYSTDGSIPSRSYMRQLMLECLELRNKKLWDKLNGDAAYKDLKTPHRDVISPHIDDFFSDPDEREAIWNKALKYKLEIMKMKRRDSFRKQYGADGAVKALIGEIKNNDAAAGMASNVLH